MRPKTKIIALALLVGAGAFLPAVPVSAQWMSPYPYPYAYYPFGYVIASSLRIEVKPKNAAVFVDGYYAGIVDDFDGTFQRLRVRPGPHDIVVYLEGFSSLHQQLYLTPDSTQTIRGALEPLAPGEAGEPRPTPKPIPESGSQMPAPPAGPPSPYGRRPPPPPQSQPPATAQPPEAGPAPAPPSPSNLGTLAIRVLPAGAEIFVDGERWEGPMTEEERLLVQVSDGAHHIEVRKDGFQTYTTDVQMRRGQTLDLNVSLPRMN